MESEMSLTNIDDRQTNISKELIQPIYLRHPPLMIPSDWDVLGRNESQTKTLPTDHLLSGMAIMESSQELQPQKTFLTKSVYQGHWGTLGMEGFGTYTLPHGVEYEGDFFDGMWNGNGILKYPQGGKIDGMWSLGKLMDWEYIAPDGLEIVDENWNYCKMPDRRFNTEVIEGLLPAGRSQLTNITPTRCIPEGCYDTGDGFYNPRTKCVVSATSGNIIRIPTKSEETWIKENCRRAWADNVGFKPELYETWFSTNMAEDAEENETELRCDTGDDKRGTTRNGR